MTVVRLYDGTLLLHSPCRLSNELLESVRNIGPVAHVVAPNWFHDLYLRDYRRTYPKATFWGPSMLLRQHGKGFIDCTLDQTTRTPWFQHMPHIALKGLLTFDECIFFHKASETLIAADLLMNVRSDSSTPPLTKLVFRLSGVDTKLVMFPYLRWFHLHVPSLREAARTILRWDPKGVIVGHGDPIQTNVESQLRNAFSWLRVADR